MNQSWLGYSKQYLQLSLREQYLILLTGLFVVIFIIFNFFIDNNLSKNRTLTINIKSLTSSNQSLIFSAASLQNALKQDPNVVIRESIAQFEHEIKQVDVELLTLTSDLIDPIQMRFALIELLKMEKGVSLLSFELIEAQPLLKNPNNEMSADNSSVSRVIAQSNTSNKDNELNLYKHGIKLKLTGSYFELRNYLLQLEQLSWKFFWQDFNFQLKKYPKNELMIEMYSLSTKQEFIGV